MERAICASTQVLTCGDLLHFIINFVPLEWEHEHGDLVRCALVCRAFYTPAIRILWRALGSLLPLWHLLAPQDALFPSFTMDESRLDYLRKVSGLSLVYKCLLFIPLARSVLRSCTTIQRDGIAFCGTLRMSAI